MVKLTQYFQGRENLQLSPALYLASALSAFFTLSWTCSALGFLCFKFLVNSWTSELETASSLPAWYISSALSRSTLSISSIEKIIAYRKTIEKAQLFSQ